MPEIIAAIIAVAGAFACVFTITMTERKKNIVQLKSYLYLEFIETENRLAGKNTKELREKYYELIGKICLYAKKEILESFKKLEEYYAKPESLKNEKILKKWKKDYATLLLELRKDLGLGKSIGTEIFERLFIN